MAGRFFARKRFGQHFLTDKRIADRIVGHAGIGDGDAVLEIGPGKGILTEALLSATASVTAVEIDRDLVPILERRFAGNPRFRLIESDILACDFEELFGSVTGKIKVVSNIPYNITGPIIELLIRNRHLVSDAVLMIQREVADRLISPPGSKKYGLMTLNVGLRGQCRKVMTVKPGSFTPPPEVTSSVVHITFDESDRYRLTDDKTFRQLTGAAFRNRRKMIRNTVIPFFCSRGLTKDEAESILAKTGVDPTVRPETLDVSSFVDMSNALDDAVSSRRVEEERC